MKSLESALIEAGIQPLPVDMTLVDVWQRLPTVDKPNKKNASVLVKPDGTVIIYNWEEDEQTVWPPSRGVTAFPLSRRRFTDQQRIERELKRQSDAADLAQKIWDAAKHADPNHPYLARKKLPALELLQVESINGWLGEWLICPLYGRNPSHKMCNLECINSDGDKRPIRGALRKVVYGFAGTGYPSHHVIIAEGWATAAALHVSLSMPIIFTAGKHNLPQVAEHWRDNMPIDTRITIAADGDDAGIEKATAAVNLVQCNALYPKFDGDWCDVFTEWGPVPIQDAFLV